MKKHLIQLVKIGQKQLAMQDEDYRAMLKRLTNKKSATLCSVPELHRVIYELQRKGAKIYTSAYLQNTRLNQTRAKSTISLKIYAIWHTMYQQGFLRDGSIQALNRYVHRILNKKSYPLWFMTVYALDNAHASHLLESLKNWHKRVMLEKLAQHGRLLDKNMVYDAVLSCYQQTIFHP
ncbi:gp16 family protein [Pasteurella oralis]|uniref:Gp16 family protein n=1 Tax=Pasteurella oralis TaxID=1071947 RepID=A0ABW4NU98_9PAST